MFWDLVKNYGAKQGYEYKYDEQSPSAVLWNPEKVFISYEDQRSIKAKANWAKQANLGGILPGIVGRPEASLLR